MKISDIKIAVARKHLSGVGKVSAGNVQSCKMALLLDAGDEDSVSSFLQFFQELGLREEEVSIVVCKEKPGKNDIFEYSFISLKDFGWNGKLTASSSAFLQAEYDVLISFTASENKMADFLVSVTRSRLKVGRKKEDENGIFDLNISADLLKPEVFIAELKKYLKILKRQPNE
ncbi:DUF6913 domain-containing protein [Salinimicrobium xinjiangense]|uniref:DUF6913 domain-containing protein n=1 Tax=Salinimicrobium xinjiangense TaxID=438596 RepID=UPI00048E8BB1|nr:hypothetical protein [Salinimicrobium xinjiangense]